MEGENMFVALCWTWSDFYYLFFLKHRLKGIRGAILNKPIHETGVTMKSVTRQSVETVETTGLHS